MDELIDAYIEANINCDLASDVRSSFILLSLFGDQFAEGYFINTLSLDGVADKNDIYDEFFNLLYKRLNEILSQHFLTINSPPSLAYVNEIVSALALFQSLDDYETASIILDGEDDDIDKVANIFSGLCSLEVPDILEHLEIESSKFIEGLKEFVRSKEKDLEEPIDQIAQKNILPTMKNLKAFLGENECVGINILKHGYSVGYEFSYYVSLLDVDEIVKEDNLVLTALNLLSLLLVSKDTYQLPMVAFDKIVGDFLSTKEQAEKCRLIISAIYTDFLNHNSSLSL